MENNTSTGNPVTSNTLFYSGSSVSSSRVLYTPSPFARSSLLYLQEVGSLKAIKPHVSGRDHLSSYLVFVVKEGEGWLEYNGVKYELCEGDAVFIDCQKGYSQSSSETLWALSWIHFNGNNMPAIYNKYCERGGKPVFHPEDSSVYINLLEELYTTASSESHIRDVETNTLLSQLVGKLFAETVYEENEDRPAVANTGSTAAINIGEIKSYIDTHYNTPLTLDSISTHFHFNKNYCAKRTMPTHKTAVPSAHLVA